MFFWIWKKVVHDYQHVFTILDDRNEVHTCNPVMLIHMQPRLHTALAERLQHTFNRLEQTMTNSGVVDRSYMKTYFECLALNYK